MNIGKQMNLFRKLKRYYYFDFNTVPNN